MHISLVSFIGDRMSSGEEEHAADQEDGATSTTTSEDLAAICDTPLLPSPLAIVSDRDKLVITPETPTTPNTPASLGGNNHHGMLSPGLGSPGAQSTSSGSGSGVDPVHDLPGELLAAGWRRFWSRRENRPYFYNKVTTESRWEMPPLPGQPDPFSDPLGISVPIGSPASAVHSRHPSTNSIGGGQIKRTSSEEFRVVKKPAVNFSPFWNFAIPSNVVIRERCCCMFLPPHAEVELLRTQYVMKLRQNYQDLCRTRESIEAPAESFNRWLLERKVYDRNPVDPLLPVSCPLEISPSMQREIMNDVPLRLVKPKYSSDARRQLVKYAEAARHMIESRGTSPESRKLVKWHAEDALDWLRKQRNASYEDYLDRLAHLRRLCQPHLAEAAQSSVESICSKVYALSCDYARKLAERHRQILAECNIHSPEHAPEPPSHRRVICYPVHLALTAPLIPNVPIERKEQGDVTLLTYKGETQRLNTPFFYKLEQLYQLNCRDDQRFDQFLHRVWCLLRRYQTFFGPGTNEGFGLQGALPVPVFECLNRVFGVTFECFASPLNCYFKQYCSAFADTDGFFGSRGPLLEFHPLSGSFEANPPFCEELMESMIDHFESLLSESQEPLSFIVFIPDWRDPPTEALVRLESSRFNRKQITISPQEHEYRSGFQHTCPSTELNVKSVHGTLVVFLQNESGFMKWEPTTERLRELLLAYRPSEPPRPAPAPAAPQTTS